MNRLFEAHNKLKHPNLSKTIYVYDKTKLNQNCAQDLLKPNTNEYYSSSVLQTTILPVRPDTQYEDILNEKGLEIYKQAQEDVKNDKFISEFPEFACQYTNSGGWFADENSKFYDCEEFKGMLNTQNNITIVGKSTGHGGACMTTSVCIFCNVKEGWCLTQSGSLYKLGNKISLFSMQIK